MTSTTKCLQYESLCFEAAVLKEHKENKHCQLNPCSKPFIEKQFYWSALLLFIPKIVLFIAHFPLLLLALLVVNVRYNLSSQILNLQTLCWSVLYAVIFSSSIRM